MSITKKLPRLNLDFYRRNTLKVAKDLLGKIIVRKFGRNILSGMIVETEAYLGKIDPASHSFRGKTPGNSVMFGKGGKAYVYFTYGNHHCFNVVTGGENIGCAVLIRAVEPLEGIETMKKNRGTENVYNLTSGPGKFTKAFSIDKKLNGVDLTDGIIYIASTEKPERLSIVRSKRIGITKNTEKLYRFFIADNPFVSRF